MDKLGHIVRNQNDCVPVRNSKQFRNCCSSVKTYPGADTKSDPTPQVGTLKIRMKKPKRKMKKIYDVRNFHNPTI